MFEPVADLVVLVKAHESLCWWLSIASVVTFIGTLILVPLLLIRMPADYFNRRQSRLADRHPIIYWSTVVGKNFLGIILLLAGITMLFLPGQGIITILLGITLLNFSGNRYLERKFISLPKVFSTINHIRRRANQPPLIDLQQEKIIGEIIRHKRDDK